MYYTFPTLSYAHICETESAFGLYFHPIYSLLALLFPLYHTVWLHKELDVNIYDQYNFFFFRDNAKVYLVFPSVSVTTDDFIEKNSKQSGTST